VQHDQELSHGGGESKLGWFASGTQSQIKSAQDGIVPGSDQCGHIQAVTHGPAAAIDRTFAAHFPTVAIKWCDSDQRCNFTAGERYQIWHFCREESSRARTNSIDGRQLLCFGRKFW